MVTADLIIDLDSNSREAIRVEVKIDADVPDVDGVLVEQVAKLRILRI